MLKPMPKVLQAALATPHIEITVERAGEESTLSFFSQKAADEFRNRAIDRGYRVRRVNNIA